MFSGFLFNPNPKKVLLVGLGGGSMVHYINKYFPDIELDVIEIDSGIVKVAKEYFYLKEKRNTSIITEDFAVNVKKNKKKYDVIFMDAFLKPSEQTDPTGINLNFKQKEFYNNLKDRLEKNGMVVFNINTYNSFKKDINHLRENFAGIYIFNKKGSGNVIVVATIELQKFTKESLKQVGLSIDNERKTSFKFQKLVDYYRETDDFTDE
jgi:spermidine synthase